MLDNILVGRTRPSRKSVQTLSPPFCVCVSLVASQSPPRSPHPHRHPDTGHPDPHHLAGMLGGHVAGLSFLTRQSWGSPSNAVCTACASSRKELAHHPSLSLSKARKTVLGSPGTEICCFLTIKQLCQCILGKHLINKSNP